MRIKQILIPLLLALMLGATPVIAGDPINLNSANVEQLQTIHGIGEKTAAAIVAYRTEHGAFKTVDALTNVKGIGDKKLEQIRDEFELTGEADSEN